jgi:hypothetical protein
MKTKPSTRLSNASLPEFFRTSLQKAMFETQKEFEAHTEYYLVHMLTRFANSKLENGTPCLDEPLAFKLKRGLELNGKKAWLAIRDLGEASLFLSSIFSQFLNRKLVDIEYCMGMGTHAYGRLATLSKQEKVPASTRVAYEEISGRFPEVVEVLWALQDEHLLQKETDLLRLYESWIRTRNPRMKRSLIRAGLLPSEEASLVFH